MRCYVLSFGVGVFSLYLWPQVPSSAARWLLLCSALLLLFYFKHCNLKLLALAMLGLCWSAWQVSGVLDQRLAQERDGSTLWLEGRVSSLPVRLQADGYDVVRFELAEAFSRRTQLPDKILLSWRNGPDVKAGERWRLAVSLKRLDALLNPHGFDYSRWLMARRVGATGTVKAGQRIAAGEGLAAQREGLRQRLLNLLPEHATAGGLVALALGDASGLSPEQWQLLQDTGTVHLFVISGQHISLVAGLAYGLVTLLVRLGVWPVRIAWLPAACGLAFAAAFAYGALAGFGVPVRRALIMIAVVLLWRMFYRPLSSWQPWLLALALVLATDPLVMLQAGFWLSFTAVAVLLLVFSGRLGSWPRWQLVWRTQWAAAVGLAPLLLVAGLPVSWVGPLANAIAVPLVGLCVLPLVLLGMSLLAWPAMAQPVLQLAGGLLSGLWAVLDMLVGELPAWQPALSSGWLLLLVGLVALLLLVPAVLRPWWVPVCLLAPVLIPSAPPLLPKGQASIWMLDVGQGQAIVVRTAQHNLLYDAGPAMGGRDAGETVVAPFLRGEGVMRLDRLILSHADADHAGGAAAVLRQLPADLVISGEPDKHRQWQARACSEETWQWDEVRFWLWQWGGATDGNSASCVLLVEAGGEKFLVTGDLDVAGERALLSTRPDLQTDWLVAGHHGSKTSTGHFWLQALQPHTVLVSRGRHNSYGHPHPLVVQRIKHNRMQLYDTAQDKALRIDLGTGRPLWSMAQQRRFWRD